MTERKAISVGEFTHVRAVLEHCGGTIELRRMLEVAIVDEAPSEAVELEVRNYVKSRYGIP